MKVAFRLEWHLRRSRQYGCKNNARNCNGAFPVLVRLARVPVLSFFLLLHVVLIKVGHRAFSHFNV